MIQTVRDHQIIVKRMEGQAGQYASHIGGHPRQQAVAGRRPASRRRRRLPIGPVPDGDDPLAGLVHSGHIEAAIEDGEGEAGDADLALAQPEDGEGVEGGGTPHPDVGT